MIVVNGGQSKLMAAGDDAMLLAWSFGVHDRSLAAWVIVAAYMIAIACCAAAWRRDAVDAARLPADRRRTRAPWFWIVVASLLFLLAINKPLDFHNLVTEYGRAFARSGGWYQHRRRVQLVFAIAAGAVSLALLLFVGWRLRAGGGRYRLALVGLWLMGAYVGLRIVSFHHVDAWFSTRLRGVKLHWIVELAAIAVIAAGAVVPFRNNANAVAATPALPDGTARSRG
jgi:hypothetical protein